MTAIYDPYSLEMHEDPYPTYKILRDDFPLYWVANLDSWALTRFHDIQTASRDWSTFSSSAGVNPDDTADLIGDGDFVAVDPPAHRRFRDVVRSHFTPKKIAALEQGIRERAAERLDAIVDRGSADLVSEYAWPLPAANLCVLLGLPRADQDQLLEWFVESMRRVPGDASVPATAWAAAADVRSYFRGLADDRLRHPHGGDDDVLSAMVAAVRQGDLSREELAGMCYLFLLAGIDTSASFISNSLLHLERDPDQRRLLVEQPAAMTAAIEELLRFDAPVQFLMRTTTRDVEIHGQSIPAEGRVLFIHAAANRDERRFDDPDRLDLTRPTVRHLAFGEGIHHCIGAPLARLGGRVALELLLERIPEYELAGEVERLHTNNGRGLARLPVQFAPAARRRSGVAT